MFKAKVYKIMIGCPSDIKKEVDIAWDVINHWNTINAESRKLVLLPIHWSISAYPIMGKKPQKELNEQLADKSDALVCIFGAKIGTPTGDYISGSVEEIEEHLKAHKPVMVFFKTSLNTSEIDIDQLAKLANFKQEFKGLYSEFSDESDFKKTLTDKLSLMINDLFHGFSEKEESSKVIEKDSAKLRSEDIKLLQQWINSGSEKAHRIDILGGASIISLGNQNLMATTSRERVEWNGFFGRLLEAGLIEVSKSNKNGNPTYRLKEEAFLLEQNNDAIGTSTE